MDKDDIDLVQAERIAVLETKVDAIAESMKELKSILEPMAALYQAGKVVVWITTTILSYTHWDQIVAFFNQLMDHPKH